MSLPSWIQFGAFLLVTIILVKPLGGYMTRVFTGERTWLDFLLRPVERLIHRFTGVDSTLEMNWKEYATCFVLFALVGTILLYLLLRLQSHFPWYDPAHMTTRVTPDLAMNTAVSFSPTTTWQPYVGESTMTYLSQLLGGTTQ